MPSPIGHALAGVAAAWMVEPRADCRLASLAAGLAMLPDLDLALPIQHRAVTHSAGAVILVTIVAALVTGQVTRPSAWRVTAVCSLAFASHLLLDWLAVDPSLPYGLQALWPFSDQFYISGLDVFRATARSRLFTAPMIWKNFTAAAQEIAILGPILWTLWLVRVKPAARFAAQMTRRHHPAE